MVTKWAERLLKQILRSDVAEAVYGDLLEEYRDSIYPSRGTLRADLWLARQVIGHFVRGGSSGLRNALLAGLVLAVFVMAFSFSRFSAGQTHTDPHSARNLLIVSAMLTVYAYTAVRRTHPVSADDEYVLQLGTRWGVAIAAAWIGSLISLNLGIPIGILLAVCGVALPFAAGAQVGIKTDRVRMGFRAGLWSGFIGGLLVFFALAPMGYIQGMIPGLPGAEIPSAQPYTAAQYLAVNVMDALGGAMAFLFMICPLLGVAGGIVGGWAGIRLARTGGNDTD